MYLTAPACKVNFVLADAGCTRQTVFAIPFFLISSLRLWLGENKFIPSKIHQNNNLKLILTCVFGRQYFDSADKLINLGNVLYRHKLQPLNCFH